MNEGDHHAGGIQHAQRSLLRIDQRDCGLDDVAQGLIEVQAGGHVEECVEQSLHRAQ
jgi:hypothetical protein